MTRMTAMVAAARCELFFAGCRNRDRNAEVGPVAATCPTLAKQPGTPTVTKCLNLPRMKKDPESSFLCPYNAANEPRAPVT